MSIYEYDEEKHMRQEREASREEGREEGEMIKLIKLVCKKLLKNKSPETIADELEEELQTILVICEAAEACAPDYDCDKIYRKMAV